MGEEPRRRKPAKDTDKNKAASSSLSQRGRQQNEQTNAAALLPSSPSSMVEERKEGLRELSAMVSRSTLEGPHIPTDTMHTTGSAVHPHSRKPGLLYLPNVDAVPFCPRDATTNSTDPLRNSQAALQYNAGSNISIKMGSRQKGGPKSETKRAPVLTIPSNPGLMPAQLEFNLDSIETGPSNRRTGIVEICTGCFETGHSFHICKIKGILCNLCQQMGHKMAKCPQKMKGNRVLVQYVTAQRGLTPQQHINLSPPEQEHIAHRHTESAANTEALHLEPRGHGANRQPKNHQRQKESNLDFFEARRMKEIHAKPVQGARTIRTPLSTVPPLLFYYDITLHWFIIY